VAETFFLGDPLTGASTVTYTVTNRYEDAINTVFVTDPRGIVTAERSDGLGRPLSQTVDVGGLNLTSSRGYDANGNLNLITDPEGSFVTATYDGLNRQIATRDELGHEQFFLHDDLNRHRVLDRVRQPRPGADAAGPGEPQ
jgi:YD repeat-containing protein